jgi:hypothetical protein
MDAEPRVGELVRRFRGGDPWAADLLFDRYARRLTAVAEQYRGRRPAGRLDGEDVVQSVFRTFFRRCAGGGFHIDRPRQPPWGGRTWTTRQSC